MAARYKFHRVGDHFAADQGCLHPFGTRRDPVIDGNGVNLDRRASGLPNTLRDQVSKLAVVPIARHRSDPAVSNADLRPRKALVGKAHRLHHGTRHDTIRSV